MIRPINGNINHQYVKGSAKKSSIALFVTDDKEGGKNICDRKKKTPHTEPYNKTLDTFIFKNNPLFVKEEKLAHILI